VPENMLTAVRLSVADAVQVVMEKSTVRAHTVSFAVIEPTGDISHERLSELVGSSLPQLIRFRSKLIDRPLGMGPPFWAEIDDYDPTAHIHRLTLQAPGGQRELAGLIAGLSAEPSHRREMLWDAWSIDGLSGGRWALAVRTSPALSERGASIAPIWSRLIGPDQHDGSDGQPEQSSPTVTAVGEIVAGVVAELVELQFKGLWLAMETVAGMVGVLRRQLSGNHVVGEGDSPPPAVSSMSGPLPRTVFNAPLTERRAVAFASLRRADLETVSTAFGGDVTNVLVAACTLSLRAWLQRHGSVPDDPLMMRVPLALSVVTSDVDGDSPIDGKIRIPVQLGDPIEVLTNLHTASARMNTEHADDAPEKADFTADLVRFASLIPSSIAHAGMRFFSRLSLRQRLTTTSHGSISYVGEQRSPAYCAGAKVIGMYSVTPLLDGGGLTITLTAQGEALYLSVCVCPDNVAEVDDIATGIVDSLDTLVAAAHESPRGQGRSVVTEMTSKRPQARAF
jgi:diacylglycerol O-acyltransferase / wax synthase